MKRVLKFHEGRGGQHYNPGHFTFVGFERIDQGKAFESCWLDENNELLDVSPNALEVEINPDGTGFINHDNSFDTTHCVFEDQLTPKMIAALVRESIGSRYDKEAIEILENHYPEHINETV